MNEILTNNIGIFQSVVILLCFAYWIIGFYLECAMEMQNGISAPEKCANSGV